MRLYSTDVKRTALEKILRPGANLTAISREMEIPRDTLYFWMRKAENGTMSANKRLARVNLREKHALVLEARSVKKEDLGRWLPEKGFHESSGDAWEREINSLLRMRTAVVRER